VLGGHGEGHGDGDGDGLGDDHCLVDHRALPSLPEGGPEVGPHSRARVTARVEPDVHLLPVLPLLVLYQIDRRLCGEAPGSGHAVGDVPHQLLALPDGRVVEQCGADLVEHLFAVPFQVEVVGALPQIPLDVHGVEEWYAMSMVWNILHGTAWQSTAW